MENEEVQGALEIVGPNEESAPVVMEWSDAQLKNRIDAFIESLAGRRASAAR